MADKSPLQDIEIDVEALKRKYAEELKEIGNTIRSGNIKNRKTNAVCTRSAIVQRETRDVLEGRAVMPYSSMRCG